MSDVIVQLPLDRTGRNPNNLIGSEEHVLAVTPGLPYKIVVMEHGGFYVKGLRVYDAAYNKLKLNTDYIVTYVYKNTSESTGLNICGAIVFLDPLRTGKVFLTAQMVGGDLCYSFSVVQDYTAFFRSQPINYIPRDMDFIGSEPIWKPGELEKERWHLDTFEPFNNEIDDIRTAYLGGSGEQEDTLRAKIDADFNNFMSKFNDRLDRHIADKSNPHVDTKANRFIELDRLENFQVATPAIAVAGTSESYYMTPQTTSLSIAEWALKPLTLHVDRRDNPHRVTVVQTNGVDYKTVNDLADTKYKTDDTVANTNFAWWDGRVLSHAQITADYRTNIPAQNFTSGFVPPTRLGGGAPTADKVLMSNGTWTNFDALTETFITEASPGVRVATVALDLTPAQAHNLVIQDPWAWTTPVGSIIFYELSFQVWWGWGNGAGLNGYILTYGSIKTDSGWQMI